MQLSILKNHFCSTCQYLIIRSLFKRFFTNLSVIMYMNKKFNLIKFYNNCLDDFFVGLKEILFYYWGCRINFGRPAGNKCYNPQMAPKYFLQTQGIIRWKNILIHWVCLFPSNTRYYNVKTHPYSLSLSIYFKHKVL